MAFAIFYVLCVITFLVGILVGSFAVSNTVLPIVVSLPFVRFLEKQDLVIKPIPRAHFVLAPLMWSLLSVGAFWLYHAFIPKYFMAFAIGFALSALAVLKRAFLGIRHPDVRADLMSYYQEYIRPGAISSGQQPQSEGEPNQRLQSTRLLERQARG